MGLHKIKLCNHTLGSIPGTMPCVHVCIVPHTFPAVTYGVPVKNKKQTNLYTVSPFNNSHVCHIGLQQPDRRYMESCVAQIYLFFKDVV